MSSIYNAFTLLFITASFVLTQGSSDIKSCKHTTAKYQKKNVNGTYLLKLESGVSYFYLENENTLLIYNPEVQFVVLIDANTGTTTDVNVTNGGGSVINLSTDASVFNDQNLQTFDMSKLEQDNFDVIQEIYNYTAKQVPRVIGNVSDDTTNIIEDYRQIAITADVTKWKDFQGQEDKIKFVQDTYQSFLNEANCLFQNYNYTADMGAVIDVVVQTKYVHIEDPLEKYIAKIPIYLIMKPDNYKYMRDIMNALWSAISSEDSNECICNRLKQLTWAINGAGFTYITMSDAMEAFYNNTVVETHRSAITNIKPNTYILYTSMIDGVWHFRIVYANQQFQQISSNYFVKHFIAWDPSMPFALNFPEGDNFGFINWKSGEGLVINAKTSKAVYARAKNSKMVDLFNSSIFPEGFHEMTKIIDDAVIDDNAFDANELLKAIRSKSDISGIMTNAEDRNQFLKEFDYLVDNFDQVDYVDEYKVVNLVGFVLRYTNGQFFHEYFVKMVHNMFQRDISNKKFYMMMYSDFMRNEVQKWKSPIFKNMNGLIEKIPKNSKSDNLIDKLTNDIKTKWHIDVQYAGYLKNGTTCKL